MRCWRGAAAAVVLAALLAAACAGGGGSLRRTPGAGFELVVDGLDGVSGLAWDPIRDELVIAERGADRLARLPSAAAGDATAAPTPIRTPAQRPAALAFDRAGNLYVLETAARSIARFARDGSRTVVAFGFDGRRFRGPRAFALGPDDELWVADMAWPAARPEAALPGPALYRVTPYVTTRLRAAVAAPVAVAFTADLRTAHVLDAAGSHLWTFRWAPGGALDEPRRRRVAAGAQPRALAVDSRGQLLVATGAAEVRVLAADGAHRETLVAPGPLTALCFGGPDRRTLFIATADAVWRLPVRWPGAGA